MRGALFGLVLLAACASAPEPPAPGPPPPTQSPYSEGASRAPITLTPDGDPDAKNAAFAGEMARRYAVGAAYAEAKADLERNGFSCQPYPQMVARADIPTHECLASRFERQCQHEWAVELREAGGALRAPARGSFAVMCLGAILEPKKPR